MARDCIYIVGAGFSAGLGYPLTADLLQRLWPLLTDDDFRARLKKVIEFHHHGFNPEHFSSFPNVEQLLSQMEVNDQFFDMSRYYIGDFTREKLRDIQQQFLLSVADWFYNLTQTDRMKRSQDTWLKKFKERVVAERAAVISFNWDLVLDDLLFGENLDAASYGLGSVDADAPVLLKPHGSLNWFEGETGRYIKEHMRFAVHAHGSHTIYAFRDLTRGPATQHDRVYQPLIIPPVFLKKFDNPIFTKLWQRATAEISTAKKVVFLGYSMPDADLHTQFIVRCGFYNQVRGEVTESGARVPGPGAAEVVIVNPDRGAAHRILSAVSPKSKSQWISTPAADWILDG
jgi:hypothetical protein